MTGYFLAGCIVGGCISFIAMCIVIRGFGMSDVSDFKAEIMLLRKENAQLRGLVRDMKAVIWAYDEYTSDDDCPPAMPLFEDRLHELGIEVDA